MMMAASLIRALTWGVVILLATTATLVHRADGTSFATTDSTSEACGAEKAACYADDTCLGCFASGAVSSEDLSECYATAGLDDFESSTLSCPDYMAGICCHDEAAEEECLDSDDFVAYYLCLLETVGCTEDEITCSGASSSSLFGGHSRLVNIFCAFSLIMLPVFMSA